MSEDVWPTNALAEISIAIKDGSHGTHKRVASGVPLLSAKNVTEQGLLQWDESDDRVSAEDYAAICSSFTPQRDDLLLTIVGTLGRRALFDGAKVAFQRSVAFVRPDHSRVKPQYLFHAVASPDFARQLIRRSNATAQAGLYLGELAKTTIPVPPLPDQARIAAVLDTVDKTIAATEAEIAKLWHVRAGLTQDLLTRGLDEQGRLRDPSGYPEEFKDSPLGRIPRGWQVGTLVGRISLPEGQVDPRVVPYSDWILVAPDHIESGAGRLIARQTAQEQGAISGKYTFEPGDVLYCKIRPNLRKAILSDEHGLCSADMYPLRPNDGVSPRFLLSVVLGESFSRFASAVSMRSGFPKINRKELAEFVTMWPSSEEQYRISEILSASDREQAAIEEDLAKLNNLRSGLMSDLLTGRTLVSESLFVEVVP